MKILTLYCEVAQRRSEGSITLVNYFAAYLAIVAGAATAAARRPRPACAEGTYPNRHRYLVLQVALHLCSR